MSRTSTTPNTASAATDDDARAVETFLRQFPELGHLRVHRRAALVTLMSGPSDDPIPHARLRRLAATSWQLEMANHMGRWQPTPFCAARDALLKVLLSDFGWALTAQSSSDPGRTSGRRY